MQLEEMLSKSLEEWFNEYNSKYFDNLVPPILIMWSNRLRSSMGVYESYQYEDEDDYIEEEIIKLSKRILLRQPYDFKNVLVHEMIHSLFPFETHGKRWTSMANYLNKTYKELNITKYCILDEELFKYIINCSNCNNEYYIDYKLDLNMWECSYCGGKLILSANTMCKDEYLLGVAQTILNIE